MVELNISKIAILIKFMTFLFSAAVIVYREETKLSAFVGFCIAKVYCIQLFLFPMHFDKVAI